MTLRSLHYTPRSRGELSDDLTYSVFKNIVERLSDLSPSLIRHSIKKKKSGKTAQILQSYESSNNGKEVIDYYIFPMVSGNMTNTHANNDKFATYRQHNAPEPWMVGRKKLIIELDHYKSLLTDNDYFDPDVLTNYDWTQTLIKRPVGRPRLSDSQIDEKRKRQYQTLKHTNQRLEKSLKKIAKLEKRINTLEAFNNQ